MGATDATNEPQAGTQGLDCDRARDFVTVLHLAGQRLDKVRDELTEIEGWFWEQLGNLREQAAEPAKTAAAADQTCTATITPWGGELIRCTQPAGHYDEAREPDASTDEIGGWHAAPDPGGGNRVWADRAEGATPAGAPDA